MYTLTHRPIPKSTLTLNPRELLLIAQALEEASEDRAEYDDAMEAAELAVLHRKFARAHDSLITH